MSCNTYESLVERLKERGIKMVAVDFDLTLISVHTGGTWMFTARPLATKVRPGFPEFISEVLKQGLFVAVVTFSPQVELIKNILDILLGEEEASKICIRGNTTDWKPSLLKRTEGKQSHIESAAKFFYKSSKVKIKLYEVLLLDDDDNNIQVAKKNSVHTLHVVDDNSIYRLIENVDEMFSK